MITLDLPAQKNYNNTMNEEQTNEGQGQEIHNNDETPPSTPPSATSPVGLPPRPPVSRFTRPEASPGLESENLIEKHLDLSDGEDATEVSVTVPSGHTSNAAGDKNKEAYMYTVTVSKSRMTRSILDNKFQELWDELEEAVLKDVNKV